MKQLIKALLLVVAFAVPSVYAGDMKDDKDLKKMIEDQGIYVETSQKGIVLSGYVDVSYTYQFASSGELGGGFAPLIPANSEADLRKFDTDNNDFNIHAFKLALEKGLGDKNEYSAGFRADLLFGEDAQTLNNGLTDPFTDLLGGAFLEQAYVQFRVPVGNGLDFKFGKFVTPMGYEVLEGPANLNFSRGLLFTNALPLTHTGVMASYRINDMVDVQAGLVNGWNVSDSFAVDGEAFGKAFLARVNLTSKGGNANLANTIYYAPNGGSDSPVGIAVLGENETTFVWDMWGNWAPKFANDKLLLGFNTVFGMISDAGIPTADNDEQWYGAALYAKYQFTPVFSLAGRLEYLHSSDSLQFGSGAPGSGTVLGAFQSPSDVYSFTLTAGFNIWENLLTRVEYRYDQGPTDMLDGGNQHQVAVNFVYSF